MESSYVYILASKRDGVLYIGVTTDLVKRVHQHKCEFIDSFTKKYHIHKLVYYEIHSRVEEAIKREKQIKSWKRQWKINLIEKDNPEWNDLYFDILE
tara:strand:- start:468 stop:758 length:291 start_codon:yes stop_codon:yes gene_type:complete